MFSQACVKNSVDRVGDGGVSKHALGQTPPRPVTLGYTPPPWQTAPTATAADGTHPTGMHSYLF